jgi:predicted neutral ceramidase superfamily lipid hydrolase
MDKKEIKDRLEFLVERLPKIANNLSMVTAIGAAIAMILLIESLQLEPSILKASSVVLSIISTMFFLSSAIIYGIYGNSEGALSIISSCFVSLFSFVAYVTLVIGLGCLVAVEDIRYAGIACFTGFAPLLLFIDMLREIEKEYKSEQEKIKGKE